MYKRYSLFRRRYGSRYSARPRYGYRRVTGRYGTYYARQGVATRSFRSKFGSRSNKFKSSVPFNPTKAIRKTRLAYVQHVSTVDSGPLQVPNGVTPASADTLQAMQYRKFDLSTWSPLDPILQNYMQTYQQFRMTHAWIEMIPKWNVVPDLSGNTIGEVIVVPLHNMEEIYRSGQANVAFGGSFGAMVETDVDYWMQIPGARRFKFEKPGEVARMRIPLTIFTYVCDNANLGADVGSTTTIRPTRVPWLNVMDVEAVSTPTVNTTRHYGFFIGFYGWHTTATNAEFNFKFRQYVRVEFKRQVAYPLSAIGKAKRLEALKRAFGDDTQVEVAETDDEAHVEDPWEDDEKASQVSTTGVKRGMTNMHLDAAVAISTLGGSTAQPPAPKQARVPSVGMSAPFSHSKMVASSSSQVPR